jgi:hypothetical protein
MKRTQTWSALFQIASMRKKQANDVDGRLYQRRTATHLVVVFAVGAALEAYLEQEVA